MTPIPTPADHAEAEAAYDASADHFGMTHDRADYVRSLAKAYMHKRLNREHKARFAAIREAVAGGQRSIAA